MRNQGARRVVTGAAAAGLAALTLSGCNSSPHATSASTASRAATHSAAKTTSSPTEQPTTTSAVHSTPAATRAAVKVGDTVSAAELQSRTKPTMRGKSAHVTLTIGPQRRALATGVVTYAADGTATEKLTEQIAGQKVELRYVEDVLYLSVPSEGSGWLAIRPGGTDALSKEFAPLLATIRQSQGGQVAVAPGVAWHVTSVAPAGATYRAHLTAVQVRAQQHTMGLDKLMKSPAKSEDVVEVLSPAGLPLSTEVVVGGVSSLQMRYAAWGPAITITAPADSTDA